MRVCRSLQVVTSREPFQLKLTESTMSGKLIVISFSSVETFHIKIMLSAPGMIKETTGCSKEHRPQRLNGSRQLSSPSYHHKSVVGSKTLPVKLKSDLYVFKIRTVSTLSE